LNDTRAGAEGQNLAEKIGSADIADGVVPIRMVHQVEEVNLELDRLRFGQ
jgi:hypothetical protein